MCVARMRSGALDVAALGLLTKAQKATKEKI
jgi:hypothetical protein